MGATFGAVGVIVMGYPFVVLYLGWQTQINGGAVELQCFGRKLVADMSIFSYVSLVRVMSICVRVLYVFAYLRDVFIYV